MIHGPSVTLQQIHSAETLRSSEGAAWHQCLFVGTYKMPSSFKLSTGSDAVQPSDVYETER